MGQSTWEEINEGAPGANYGWSLFEGPGGTAPYRDPIYAYRHAGGTPTGCAIVGGAFYDAARGRYPADFANDYFFADLCGGWIWRYDTVTGAAAEFVTGVAAPVDLAMGPEGDLYYLARSGATGGEVYRVSAAPPFTDDPLVPRVTAVKAVHVAELRQRIDELRVRAGLSLFSWTDAVVSQGATPVRAVHLAELRTALLAVYAALSRTPPTFTPPSIVAGVTVIAAAHVAELRAAVRAIW